MNVNYLISNLETSIDHEFDLGIEDSNYLLKELVKSSNTENRLWVESSSCALDFYLNEDRGLWVEICFSRNDFWAISEINSAIGEEMIKVAFMEKDFSEIMPTTDRNWDAYSSPEK